MRRGAPGVRRAGAPAAAVAPGRAVQRPRRRHCAARRAGPLEDARTELVEVDISDFPAEIGKPGKSRKSIGFRIL